MEWYWYLSGIITTLFIESILLNVGLAKGWVQYISRRSNKVAP